MSDEKYYERLGFTRDPYTIRSPEKIPLDFIDWDRPDLDVTVKRKLELFLSDIKDGITIGMRIFGQWGSGKTWLIRYIEKLVFEEKETFTIYSKIDSRDVSLHGFYRLIIEDLLGDEKANKIKNRIREFSEKGEGDSLTEDDYKELFDDSDIATCFYQYFQDQSHKRIAERWLKGQKLTTDQVKKLDVTNQNDNDYDRYRVLEKILESFSKVFSTIILFADQLEESVPRVSRPLGDILRSYLDNFPENFVLVVSYISEESDSWYDIGFTDSLLTRIRYHILLTSIEENSIVPFMKKHHEIYGKSDLTPLTEEGLKHLWKILKPEYRYPRFIFTSISVMSKMLLRQRKYKEIVPDFIEINRELIGQYVENVD